MPVSRDLKHRLFMLVIYLVVISAQYWIIHKLTHLNHSLVQMLNQSTDTLVLQNKAIDTQSQAIRTLEKQLKLCPTHGS